MSRIIITTPLSDEVVSKLGIGQRVFISGSVYAAGDAAHKKLIKSLEKSKRAPFDLKGRVMYYAEFSPARPDRIVGAVGPVDSEVLDAFMPVLLQLGVKGVIGKGKRSPKLIKDIIRHRCIYFTAVGGAAALLSRCIKSSKIIAYPELGVEAIHELVVEYFPLIVVNDILGRDLYEEGAKLFANNKFSDSDYLNLKGDRNEGNLDF